MLALYIKSHFTVYELVFVTIKLCQRRYRQMLLLVFFSYIQADASQESNLTIPVGNVTMNTELTYEFGVRKGFSPPQDGMLDISLAYYFVGSAVLPP